MSRVGKKPIPLPDGVEVKISREEFEVKGPRGSLMHRIPSGISVHQEGSLLVVTRKNDIPKLRALHGLMRSLAANSVTGVTEGFQKELEIEGIGYRAQIKKDVVVFQLGFSHPIEFQVPEGVEVKIEGANLIVVSGIDRQKVGQVAANICRLRRPDVYKGKGIRYKGEVLRKKVGKAATGT
ncbi:MAG: 50S ribosomal protein L6 [Candidatus Aminicenantes bacterium]|nr:50S ribosomal protein L6 [Candidatus Aminicenantes bacterium]MDH5714268.1 50S ribosomal protein L6 [Candidatus Aminicenantes bacterium]